MNIKLVYNECSDDLERRSLKDDMVERLAPKDYTVERGRVGLLLVGLTQLEHPNNVSAQRPERASDTRNEYSADRVGKSVIPAVKAITQALRARREPVLWCKPLIMQQNAADWPPAVLKRLMRFNPTLCRPGLPSWEVISGLSQEHTDYEVATKAPSCFWGGNADAILRNRRVERLLVMGTTTNYSVLINAIDAAERSYQVTIVEDGTAALTEDEHMRALTEHPYRCSVATSTELLKSLEQAPAVPQVL